MNIAADRNKVREHLRHLPEGMSIREIARRSGIAHTSLINFRQGTSQLKATLPLLVMTLRDMGIEIRNSKPQEMNPYIKNKWVKALRKYRSRQAFACLRDIIDGQYHYDAWGVLCELWIQENPHHKLGCKSRPYLSSEHQFESLSRELRFDTWYKGGIDPHGSGPTQKVLKWAGIRDPWELKICINRKYDLIQCHNDGGATLDQIADAIERDL